MFKYKMLVLHATNTLADLWLRRYVSRRQHVVLFDVLLHWHKERPFDRVCKTQRNHCFLIFHTTVQFCNLARHHETPTHTGISSCGQAFLFTVISGFNYLVLWSGIPVHCNCRVQSMPVIDRITIGMLSKISQYL